MSRTKFFINNSLAMILQQIVNFAVAFIVPRFLLVAYGSQINGLIVSITQFVIYFALVEAGISGASIYSLYKPLANKDTASINSILSASKKFYFQSGYIFVVLVSLLAIFYPFFTDSTILSNLQIAIIVFSIGMSGVFDFFALAKYRVLLTADQKSFVISFATIISSIIKIILVIIFCSFKLSVVWLQVFLVLCVYSRSLVLWIYTNKNYKFLNFKVTPNNEAIKDRWNVLYLQLLGCVQYNFPIIIATFFTSLYQVSVYSIYNMILSGIAGILGVFISGLAASFGDVIAKKEIAVLQKANQEFETFYYMLITIVYSTSIFLMIPFIKLYTKGITDVNYILPLLSFFFIFNGLLYNIKTPQRMLVISAGLYRQTRWQSTIQSLIIIVMGIPLTYLYGLYGVLISLICSNIYRDIDLLFFIPKYVTKLSYKYSLNKILLILFNFGLCCLFSLYIEITCNTYFEWIFYAVIITIIISIWVLITNIILNRQNVINICFRIKKLICRK